jgi:hypothetical protein
MRAIEVTGSVNEDGFIALDQPIVITKPRHFRGILLLPDTDITEEWSPMAIDASLREYLDDPEEDIYTLEDGEPIEDEA